LGCRLYSCLKLGLGIIEILEKKCFKENDKPLVNIISIVLSLITVYFIANFFKMWACMWQNSLVFFINYFKLGFNILPGHLNYRSEKIISIIP